MCVTMVVKVVGLLMLLIGRIGSGSEEGIEGVIPSVRLLVGVSGGVHRPVLMGLIGRDAALELEHADQRGSDGQEEKRIRTNSSKEVQCSSVQGTETSQSGGTVGCTGA